MGGGDKGKEGGDKLATNIPGAKSKGAGITPPEFGLYIVHVDVNSKIKTPLE